ncbi:fungal-specific transcription factor domain-containing protein [Stachybotrys elegans]|uniref:Fungal-specific transcription factor domain-containing protein n=1 Tax=Stachybotrys elegans TaxID=80388 RepID=A0A8K0SWR5_9HYPO|nr:fungal-specific transcription factor domain-containing protein [Stachybotrys elegans]
MDGLESHIGRQRRVAERERKRAVRACDNCRRQKEKCDGGVPCRRCQRLHRQCEFAGLPASAAGEPGLDGLRNRRIAELEQRMGYMETLLNHYTGKANLDLDTLRTLTQSVEEQQPVKTQSPDLQSLSSGYLGPDDEDFTFQPLTDTTLHYSGEHSHWNFSMRIQKWIQQCVPTQGKDDATHSFKEYYRPEELQSPSTTTTSLSALPPRYVADFLVHNFFKHAQTNYFYVDKGWLMEKLDLVYRETSSFTRRDVSIVCILFIVFAIGTRYAHLESQGQTPSQQAEAASKGPFSEDAIGIMFYQQACRLVPDVITLASLESVQACLLIGVFTNPLDASGLSWTYLNLALKMAILNGMQRNCPKGELDPWTREVRNRVFWSAYFAEKRVGTYHGRPISLQTNEIDAEMPTNCPHLLPSLYPNQYAYIMATLQLNQALNRIAQEISVLRTYTRREMAEKLGTLVELKTKLETWWQQLPEDIFQKEPQNHAMISRSAMHLKLEYCVVRIFTGRPFIFPREPVRGASSNGSPDGPPSRPPGSHRSNARSMLVSDCVEAAMSVINTCQVLRNSIGLARASYTEFSSCRAALLVIVTQCLQKKTDRLRDALRIGMSMIKEMAAGGESATSEASLIEAFERAIARLDESEQNEELSEPNTSKSDYNNFKRWEMLWKNDPPSEGGVNGISPGGALMPLPPQPMQPLQSAGVSRHEAMNAPLSLPTPFFGVDANLQPFSQSMDESPALFGYDFGLHMDDTPAPGGNAHLWMP